jgi:hypothetical protein
LEYFVTNVTDRVFSDNTSTFLISMFFRHEIYIDGITLFHMTSTFITSVHFRHDIYIYDISVFQT